MSDTTENSAANANVKKHTGGCHCGAVQFEVMIDTSSGSMCNCSICAKTAALGGAVKPDAFKLLSGADSLLQYEWGGKISRRMFCKHCGIHCFGPGHLKEMGGDYVSVNFRCIDGFDAIEAKVTYWDGRHDNWYAGARDTPWPIKSASET